eukprot:10253358-Ditylum_brightwellii.AAC.1
MLGGWRCPYSGYSVRVWLAGGILLLVIEALDSNCSRDFSHMIAWMVQCLSAMVNLTSTESMLVIMRDTCAKSPIA